MVAQAQFNVSDVMVQPGGQETLSITLINLGSHTESFTLVPAGLLAGWTRIEPPTVTLFGGSHQQINVTLRPPQLPTTPAGPAPLTVRVIPQAEPDEVVIAETTVHIGAFDDRRIHLLQPVVRSRRRAMYEFLVENQGNSQASCRLHLIDTSQRLDGDFDPPAVGVEPGGTSLVRLRMKAVHRHWRRGARTLPFSIEADQQGFPTAVANATFIQTAAFPDGFFRKALALLVAAGALVGVWFWLIKPATEDAARDAVTSSTTPTVTIVTVPGDTAPPQSTVPVTVVAPPADQGQLWNSRFEVVAQPQQVGETTFPVDAGKVLHISDVFLQNVNNDSGIATLYRNDEVIAQWNLADGLPNNDPLQFSSGLVFTGGTTIKFQVRCDAPGTSGINECHVAWLLSGRILDAS